MNEHAIMMQLNGSTSEENEQLVLLSNNILKTNCLTDRLDNYLQIIDIANQAARHVNVVISQQEMKETDE
jgi:hypothetical protein